MKKFFLVLMCCLLAIPVMATAQENVKKVPVLMYHAFNKTDDYLTVSENRFEEQVKAMVESGYTPVFFQDLIDYVDTGKQLPEKPVCITFDDGYLDNYTYAFPILKKYNCKATIFVIGSSIGKKTYKDTNYPINEHFGYDVANEMIKSGLIDIQSHTYDMHQSIKYEENANAQTSIVRNGSASLIDYIRKLKNDINTMKNNIDKNLNHMVNVLAYPGGYYDNISESILKQMGIRVTLTTVPGMNYLEVNNKNCLYQMKRMNVEENITPEDLINSLEREGYYEKIAD